MRLLKTVWSYAIVGVVLAMPAKAQVNKIGSKKVDSVYVNLKLFINQTVFLTPTKKNATNWAKALWGMGLMLYKPKGFSVKIIPIIAQLNKQSPGFQYAFLQMLYTLYPTKFATQIQPIWQQLGTAKTQAIALEYLAQNHIYNLQTARPDTLAEHLQTYITNQKKIVAQPQQNDFLDTTFLPGKWVLCSFQNRNRNYPGYAMIRTNKHTWLCDGMGKVYRFPQLARSITNLPYYLTNGNTPQGLYQLNGCDTSNNQFIGSTTNIQMLLPFEAGDIPFFKPNNIEQAADIYAKMLSPKLSAYHQLWQSFTAGKLGRTEVIAHGTAINPLLYKNQQYYPHTPSLGCLCSPELWNDNNQTIYSFQQLLVAQLLSNTDAKSYAVVAEIADFKTQFGKVKLGSYNKN